MTYPAKKSSSWSKNIGTMPVAADVQVEVVVRAGRQVCRAPAGHFSWDLSPKSPTQGDILKWRLA